MKRITLLPLLFLFFFQSFGQCPTTDLILTTQAEIDDFAINYPNCSVLTHELQINGENSIINNLNGLSLITEADYIFILQTQIQDLYGLDNLVDIDHLALWFNVGLENLEGLTSVENIGSMELFINSGVTNLSGMDNIQNIDNLNLFSNANLDDITHLSFIESMSSLTLGGNALTSLSGLENLATVSGDLSITNESVSHFNELVNLQSIGGSLYIAYNDQIQDLSAFSNIETLESLYILECPSLIDLAGFESLHTIHDKFRIGFNNGLITLAIFNELTSVANLDVYENAILESLKGLENLQEITQRLFINNNPTLSSIEALKIVSPDEVDEVAIIVNQNLSICDNQFICEIIDDPSVNKSISNNASGCNSVQEVIYSCIFSDFNGLIELNEGLLEAQLEVYPNPVSEILTIAYTERVILKKATIYTMLGKRVLEVYNEKIDFSIFDSGIYFVEIKTDKGSVFKKIIKR